ncbi:hypothetical protein BaRGS_00002799 [Batillaria attramentaria]|uniref:DUF1907 domain-containing protein n=1 Tax=Batillaria attramentaria TaxID=370345 RepID=A0ABD0M384_9CAEN
MPPPVAKAPMHVPSLGEVAEVLQAGLEKNFSTVQVSVVDCPDLTQKPFCLSAKGICGSPRLADVGGPPFLLPLPQKDKSYNLAEIAKLVELPEAFVIGAGAGPWKQIGTNSELIASAKVAANGGDALCCNSYTAKVDAKNGSCVLDSLGSLDFNLMGNFLCSEGKPGKVLEIKASKRTGEENFMSAVRKTLQNHYKTKPVALGGVFLVEKGKAKLHIMPDFSCVPLNSDQEVDSWLKFYEMDAVLVCLGELVSHDPGLDLRVEHFHCFSDHGQGGHYHYDTTPNDVAYRAYFNVAEFLYRVDQPTVTNKIVLQAGLEKNFSAVQVSVVDCPDLTQQPFNLSAKGICGRPRLADVGGPPNMFPFPRSDKVYNMEVIAKLVELPQAFIIGAGAARSSAVGVFAELAASVKVATSGGEPCCCNSYSARVDLEDGSCVLERLPSTLDFEMMGNFFCSEGNPGKVLEIKASKRTGEENFMSAVRKTLQNHYKTKPVALGGPPKFPNTPLDSDEAVNSWLRFYEMDAILVCVGELVSHDPDLDLRVEHFHCFSDHGQGGHYHYDTTPNDVVYRAYFNVAEFVYRIDQPVVANKIYHS